MEVACACRGRCWWWQVQAGRRLVVPSHQPLRSTCLLTGTMQTECFSCPCPGKQFCFIFSKAGLKTRLLCGSLPTLASSLSREAVTFMNFCGWCCVSRLSYVLSRVMWETRFQLLFWFIPLVVYLFIFFPISCEIYVKRLIWWNLLHYKLYAAQQVRLDKCNISWNSVSSPLNLCSPVFHETWHFYTGESISES